MNLDRQVDAVFNAVVGYIPEKLAKGFAADIRADIRKALTPPSLDDYGLTVGEAVKFTADGKTNKKTGTVVGINADGSVEINDGKRSYARSIRIENIFHEVHGPRGGSKWLPVKGQ